MMAARRPAASKAVLYDRPGVAIAARVLSGLTGPVLPCHAGCSPWL
ncbi:hypothetical protein [Breznakiella homolactica]|uniref:Uncharacterized protein n=1 Tax=Breznakiella homolactica TaxID=2798577 RepID=A0A7T7XRG2_9SPIR|nr:hypothetical protein [Breznakiella homolactica]QQO11125.1 hypothetical protein JFL75_09470 [Breznakiella homolactica]